MKPQPLSPTQLELMKLFNDTIRFSTKNGKKVIKIAVHPGLSKLEEFLKSQPLDTVNFTHPLAPLNISLLQTAVLLAKKGFISPLFLIIKHTAIEDINFSATAFRQLLADDPDALMAIENLILSRRSNALLHYLKQALNKLLPHGVKTPFQAVPQPIPLPETPGNSGYSARTLLYNRKRKSFSALLPIDSAEETVTRVEYKSSNIL